MENYYEIFGVSPDAPKAEIERAYRRLSKAYHPDEGATDDRMFVKIQEIHRVLKDTQLRAEYDLAYRTEAAEEEKRSSERARSAENGAASSGGTGKRRATPRSTGEDWSTPEKPEKPDCFALMKTAGELLEKGNWKRADEVYARVLNEKPKEAKAWLGRLMASVRVREKPELAGVPKSFENNEYYIRCMACAGKMLREELNGYLEKVKERILSEKYDAAVQKMKTCSSPRDWQQTASMFRAVGEYKDAESLARRCSGKADGVRNDEQYRKAADLMKAGDAEKLVEAVGIFRKIPDWKDSGEQIGECYRLLAELKAKEADKPYQTALGAMKSAETTQDFTHAAELFEALGDYRDAKKKAKLCRKNAEGARLDAMYRKAAESMTGDRISVYEDAIRAFQELDGWKDSEEQIAKCQKAILEIKRERYARASALISKDPGAAGYLEAASLFESLSGYRDSRKQGENCRKEAAYYAGLEKMAVVSSEKEQKSLKKGKAWYLDQLAACSDAAELFSEIPGWRDADEHAETCLRRAEELKKLIPLAPEKESGRKTGTVQTVILGILAAAVIAGFILLVVLKKGGVIL